jgi:hypothetical protein
MRKFVYVLCHHIPFCILPLWVTVRSCGLYYYQLSASIAFMTPYYFIILFDMLASEMRRLSDGASSKTYLGTIWIPSCLSGVLITVWLNNNILFPGFLLFGIGPPHVVGAVQLLKGLAWCHCFLTYSWCLSTMDKKEQGALLKLIEFIYFCLWLVEFIRCHS